MWDRRLVRLRLLVSIGVVASLLLWPAAKEATAAQTCSGQVANYTDGLHTANITTYGAYAYINTRAGARCTGGAGSTSFSTAWTMLADNYYYGNDGYAQSGYLYLRGNSTTYYFAQYRRSSSYTPVSKYGNPASGTNLYVSGYQFDTGHICMWVGSTSLLCTNFDPAAGVWQAPWDSEYMGETAQAQDDMPGISSAHVTFSTIRYLKCRSCGWVSLPSGLWRLDVPSRYHQSGSLSQFDIWTYPLS